jgi:hypothetical protein
MMKIVILNPLNFCFSLKVKKSLVASHVMKEKLCLVQCVNSKLAYIGSFL